MTLLSSLRDIRNGSIENPMVPLTGGALIDFTSGPMSNAGVPVSEKSAVALPAVWRAVNLIAGSCASLPLKAYRQDGEDRTPLVSGQAAELLGSPHPDLTPFELWEQVFAHILLWGNAYLRVLRDQTGRIAELWPVHPSRVTVGRASDGSKVYVVDQDLNGPPLTDREILHIPGFGHDGIAGISPIRAARQGIGMGLAMEDYGARLFGNGSLATGILQTDQRLTQEQADTLKARWRDKNTGLKSAHDTVVLDAGAKFQQLTIPPQDAQFLESRKFQVIEIARLYGIPPHMLMDVEKSTSWGTGIEQQSITFVVYTLRPWLTRVEQRMTRLLRPNAVYARYAVEGLLRGDTAARFAGYAQGRQWGWLSVNDIRTLENLSPVEGGDTYLQPLNMAPLGTDPSSVQPEGTNADVAAA